MRRFLIFLVLLALVAVPASAVTYYGLQYQNTSSIPVLTSGQYSTFCAAPGMGGDRTSVSGYSIWVIEPMVGGDTFNGGTTKDINFTYTPYDPVFNPGFPGVVPAPNMNIYPTDTPVYLYVYCETGAGFYGTWNLSNTTTPVPVCLYSATPQLGQTPLDVTFADTSTNSTTSWIWDIRNNATSAGEITATLQSFSAYLNGVGSWDVNFTAANSYGSCNRFDIGKIITTASAIPQVDITLRFVDSVTGSLVQDTAVGVYDWNHSEWYNVTAVSGILPVTYTGTLLTYPLLLGQVILVDAHAVGYATKTVNVTALYNGFVATIPLVSVGTIPGAGNSTVQFNIVANANGQALPGVWVTFWNNSFLYSQMRQTNSAGSTTFENLPIGLYQYTAYKNGYQQVTAYTATTGGVITTVDLSLVATGATPTLTGTPTAGATAGPTPDTRTASQKDADIMDLLRDNGYNLVTLAILATFVGLLKIMSKK